MSLSFSHLFVVASAALSLAACSEPARPEATPKTLHKQARAEEAPTPSAVSQASPVSDVVLYTDLEPALVGPIIDAFRKQSGLGVQVESIPPGDGSGLAVRLKAEQGHPVADVIWAADPVRIQPIAQSGGLAIYPSPEASAVPKAWRDSVQGWVGVGARARVLLVNPAKLEGAAAPTATRDLLRARGKAAMAEPRAGSAQLHVAALFSLWEESMAGAFVEALRTRGVVLEPGESGVRDAVMGGKVAWGMLDSDVAYGALKGGGGLIVVYPDQEGIGTLVLPSVVGLVKRAPHDMAGRRLVDVLVGEETERALVGAGWMPLREGLEPPVGLKKLKDIRAMQVSFETVAGKLEQIRPTLLSLSAGSP